MAMDGKPADVDKSTEQVDLAQASLHIRGRIVDEPERGVMDVVVQTDLGKAWAAGAQEDGNLSTRKPPTAAPRSAIARSTIRGRSGPPPLKSAVGGQAQQCGGDLQHCHHPFLFKEGCGSKYTAQICIQA